MAENKNAIIVYRDWINIFDELEEAEAGRLIQHFFRYVNDKNPEPKDRLTKLLFEPIKATLKRDLKSYESKCLKNSDNVRLRWNKKDTSVYDRIPTDTNHTDRDRDRDSDKDIDNDKEKKDKSDAKAPHTPKIKLSVDFIPDEEFRFIVSEWIQYKGEIKDQYKTQRSIEAFYKDLIQKSGGDAYTAKKITNQSIGNGYKGIFPLKENGNGRQIKQELTADQQNQRNRDFIMQYYTENVINGGK